MGAGVSKSVRRKKKRSRVDAPRDGLPPVIKVKSPPQPDAIDAYIAACNQLTGAVLAWAIATEKALKILRAAKRGK